MTDRASILETVCQTLDQLGKVAAARTLTENYPFIRGERDRKAFSKQESLRIFVRDGFVDRYSGKRLLFPGVLRLLSLIMPEEFPFHPNWKITETHPAYWETFPTLDHIVPIARGGENNESNIVTTSMQLNSAKGNWTLEELGWSLRPSGSISEWDGLQSWFFRQCRQTPKWLENDYVLEWYNTSKNQYK